MKSQRILALSVAVATMCALGTAQPIGYLTEFVEMKPEDCLSNPPSDQVCLFEKENYQGNCTCVGLSPEYKELHLRRTNTMIETSAKSVWIPEGSDLVINTFTDDYVRNSTSIDSSTPVTARRPIKFVVGKRNTVCLFDDHAFIGKRLSLPADSKPFTHPRGFRSIMFFPNTGSGIKVEVNDGQCFTSTPLEPFDKPLTEITVSTTKQETSHVLSFDDAN